MSDRENEAQLAVNIDPDGAGKQPWEMEKPTKRFEALPRKANVGVSLTLTKMMLRHLRGIIMHSRTENTGRAGVGESDLSELFFSVYPLLHDHTYVCLRSRRV